MNCFVFRQRRIRFLYMTSVALYFKVHQPERLKNYSIFDIGKHTPYFDDERNKFYLDRVVEKSYLPTLQLIRELIHETEGGFKVNLGVTGTLIEQLHRWHPEIIKLLQDIAKTGCVEFTGETYYHSLASLYSHDEFKEQVLLHRQLMQNLFHQTPKVFSNSELIYFDDLSPLVSDLGFTGIIAEGVPWILNGKTPNAVYQTPDKKLKVVLRNFHLSDDIGFRFSSKQWEGWPLTPEKFAYWLSETKHGSDVIGLFMDFETFGEHHWKDTGIFDFLSHLPTEISKHEQIQFDLLSDVISSYEPRGIFSSKRPITWADTERDLTAWLDNHMQKETALLLYSIEKKIKHRPHHINKWRKLQTADHFYYMCTKWFADGDVHAYFNPYENPYEAYISYKNVLEDLLLHLSV